VSTTSSGLARTPEPTRGGAEYKTSIIRGCGLLEVEQVTVAHIHGAGSRPSHRGNRNAYQRLKARQDPSNPMHEVHRRHTGRFRYSTGDIAIFYSDFELCFKSVYCLKSTLRRGRPNIKPRKVASCGGKGWKRAGPFRSTGKCHITSFSQHKDPLRRLWACLVHLDDDH
jgi:hypothetical protein